jgi:hypothetical protein
MDNLIRQRAVFQILDQCGTALAANRNLYLASVALGAFELSGHALVNLYTQGLRKFRAINHAVMVFILVSPALFYGVIVKKEVPA